MAEAVLPKLDSRVPIWDPRFLRPRDCPFCGDHGEERYVRPDDLHISLCGRCGTFFVSPAPDKDTLHAFYRQYYADHSPREEPDPSVLLAEEPYADFRITEISTYVKLSGARVLDVGCGWGNSLIRFRKLGAEVHGLDLDPSAVQFVRDRLGIPNVTLGSMEDCSCTGPFDVITMFDLIEHPLFPMDTLRIAASLLKHKGILAVWTPNASFALDEVEPVLFRVDLEHMQYLCLRTCDLISKILAVEIVHLETCGFPFLEGIQRPRLGQKDRNLSAPWIKTILRGLPGFKTANAVRTTCLRIGRPRIKEPRLGRYHLFCIFAKPE
jgi:2-polyprenyl-3-methyl-5-hydroxy-6-metoxy-1,4-benzoquinol methylase